MAKKSEKNQIKYLEAYLPQDTNAYVIIKLSWGGLNKRYELDTGELSDEKNISTYEYPYLTPSASAKLYADGNFIEYYDSGNVKRYSRPNTIFGYGDALIYVYTRYYSSDDEPTKYFDGAFLCYYNGNNSVRDIPLATTFADDKEDRKVKIQTALRSATIMSVYTNPSDVVTSKCEHRLLIFPDKKSISLNMYNVDNPDYLKHNESVAFIFDNEVTAVLPTIDDTGYDRTKIYFNGKYSTKNARYYYYNFIYDKWYEVKQGYTISYPDYIYICNGNFYDRSGNELDGYDIAKNLETNGVSIPDMDYVTTFCGRLFGADGGKVYASGYNDYANWKLDTAEESRDSNAWVSATQSNTKAGGDITAITQYNGHVIVFKKDFMHEVYNTKNPFRITDIFEVGTIDSRTVCEVDGRLFFVSEKSVNTYTGGNPVNIGYNLGIDVFKYAVAGTDDRHYFLYCDDDTPEMRNRHLFVYDTLCNEWSERLIDKRVINFAHNTQGMFMLCDDGLIYKLDTEDYNHEWSFETDLITRQSSSKSSATSMNIKHIRKVQMMVDLADGANLKVYALYDGEPFNKDMNPIYDSNGKTGRLIVRVKLRKSAHYGVKIHVEGYGYAKLYDLELFMQQGGDLYV